ncbi:Cytochrome p450 [Thalictrum thalictroides]|uniref:Cytochrome p450 n=1 Tax=Thalictrum thalictroides TaxID=46969 RepID=A0A7J6VX67_THATH|nr:Cytochrome p450 [Thalictrum thalictroides]
MEWNWTVAIWAGACLVIGSLILGKKKKGSQGRRPPGPPGWPIIGNIFDLGVDAHQSLATLSRKYGPVMWLQLGATNTLVVSSAEVAMEMFKKHDLAISDRAINEGFKTDGYDQASMVLAPYGTFWRMMRRIYTTELFTNNRIKATEEFRTKSMDKMLEWMWKDAQEKGSVEVARFIEIMNFNAIGNAIFSKDIVDPIFNRGTEFFTSTTQALELIIQPNVADFFPWLRWLDPQRVKKKMKPIMRRIISFSSSLVKERILDRENGKRNEKKDFLDVMLDFQGNQLDGESAKLSERNISVGIQELLQAATDTSTSTIEWAMTELLRNPKIMRKVEAVTASSSLIHTFEWSLEDGTTPDKINVNEKLGLTLRKADPLKVVLKLRSAAENVAKMDQ